MVMSHEHLEKQEKLLSSLQWLIERSKRDFNGNPSQFCQPKNQRSVRLERERRKNAQAADTDFLPFWHTQTPLAVDATTTAYLKNIDNSKFDTLRQRQITSHREAGTGFSEIQAALCWDVQPPQQGPMHRNSSFYLPVHAQRTKRDPYRLNELPPFERIAALREEFLLHSMVTESSATRHGDRWCKSTQLSGAAPKRPTVHERIGVGRRF